MKLFTWWCPQCGDGQPGAYVPRHDNPCRACVTCSLRTGKIVRRFRDGPYGRAARRCLPLPDMTWDGIDLALELKRLCNLEIVPARLRQRSPRLKVTPRPERPKEALAWANMDRQEIEIFVWPKLSPEEVLGSLVHELAHLVVGPMPGASRRDFHNDTWRMTYVELVREGYGVEPAFPARAPRSASALDCAVEAALKQCVPFVRRRQAA